MYLRFLPALLLSCMLQPLAAGVSDARLPVIFIGAAYQDRREQLRDMGSWKVVAKHGAVPLCGPAPHAVCRSPLGWKDMGWDHLRDLSIYKGYRLDAPPHSRVFP